MGIAHRRLGLRPILAILVLLPAAGRLTAAADDKPPERASANGQLIIEGDHVARLTLDKWTGTRDAPPGPDGQLVLDHPAASLSIPAGQYRLAKIELTGGYSCYVPERVFDGRARRAIWGPELITISPDRPCSIKVGAPLKTVLIAHRDGRNILLVYRLLDAQSEWHLYVRGDRNKPPRFTAYCNGHKIGSGSFEYG